LEFSWAPPINVMPYGTFRRSISGYGAKNCAYIGNVRTVFEMSGVIASLA
jgi:hypothetical protein